MSKRRLALALLFAPALAVLVEACVEPPPKIDSIPASGLALRVTVFGASAEDMRRSLEAVKQNNKSFSLVTDGGDGEVLVGLDNDSPACVAPTALCSYKVAYRIRDNEGKTIAEETTSVNATSDHCSGLCAKALNNISVKVVEAAAAALKGSVSSTAYDGGEPPDGAIVGGELAEAVDAAPPAPTHHHSKSKTAPPVDAAKPEPTICSVGHGAHLPSDEAEKRAAQVEVLKRINVLDQDEYDCLRKAYLERL